MKYKYLLGIVAVISCIILSTFNTVLDNPLHNVGYWGVLISIVYMVLSNLEGKKQNQ